MKTWRTATIGLLLACIVACENSPVQDALGDASSDGGSSSDDGSSEPLDERLLILPDFVECDADQAGPERLRVATWNISATWVSSIDAVRDELAAVDADVVLIQEIEIGARRTDEIDQPAVLSAELGYAYAFAAALKFDGGDFGMAVFSRIPFQSARRISLDSIGAYEPRIAVDATVCAGAMPLRLIDVHADFMPEANIQNLGELADRLGPADERILMAGDFNAVPDAEGVRDFLDRTGAVDLFAELDPSPTREGERIDFVLTSDDLAAAVTEGAVVPNEASDHALLWVDLSL